MPRFKQLAEIQQFMREKERIRNLGIVAHIDHGKTTLADALLAGSGLLSPQMAGIARVLDYLEEEQKRKITIKAANISLLYKSANGIFLLNLVDTPGHVDFTGKVTRALRAIDGAVVVVDAVEGIMAQTEIVTRQALQERVKPVLFINKVDRLITELQLTSEQIQQKLDRIIDAFNDLIELYCEEPFKDEWKVDPKKGSVAFGSALDGWGFTLDMAKEKGARFSEVADAYAKQQQAKVAKTLPVYNAIFRMAARNLPSPKQAQAYRVGRIWSGAVNSKAGKAIAQCAEDQFTIGCVTHVQSISSEGNSTATVRLFSGTLKSGDILYSVNAMRETTVSKVYVSMGSLKEEIAVASAGNIAILEVSGPVAAGETLVDAEHKAGMVPFEGINYVSEPVLTVTVEPKNPRDIFDLLKALNKLIMEDPNLAFSVDKETGEYRLSVMGELHLEVALSQLKTINSRLHLTVSAPRVAYRETVTKEGASITAASPNRQNRFTVQVKPEQELVNQLCIDEDAAVLSMNEQRNVLVDCNGKTDPITEEVLESIIAGFEFACNAGPLCGEPVRHVKVDLLDIQLAEESSMQSSAEVMRGVGKAIFGSFLTAKPILLEPVYKTVVTVPTELAGECSRILETKRGKISSFEQKGLLTVIAAQVPVAETFGMAKRMRSATSGRAFWQNILDRWEPVPEKLAAEVILDVRKRKGLAADVPTAGRFTEEN
jgi:elongation factor 2